MPSDFLSCFLLTWSTDILLYYILHFLSYPLCCTHVHNKFGSLSSMYCWIFFLILLMPYTLSIHVFSWNMLMALKPQLLSWIFSITVISFLVLVCFLLFFIFPLVPFFCSSIFFVILVQCFSFVTYIIFSLSYNPYQYTLPAKIMFSFFCLIKVFSLVTYMDTFTIYNIMYSIILFVFLS